MTSLTWPTEATRFQSKIPNEQYRENYDQIFGKKPAEQPPQNEEKK